MLHWHIVLSFLVFLLLLVVIMVLSKSTQASFNKMAPFECGFWPHSSSRLPFSLQFFLIALVFLIFDVELIMLFPLVLKHLNVFVFTASGFIAFMVILFGGLGLEWSQGSLEWLKYELYSTMIFSLQLKGAYG